MNIHTTWIYDKDYDAETNPDAVTTYDDFFMYDGTRGTRNTNETFNFDFPSDGYTMRVNLATPDNVVDYRFGYEDRSVIKVRDWIIKYYNGTVWYTEG